MVNLDKQLVKINKRLYANIDTDMRRVFIPTVVAKCRNSIIFFFYFSKSIVNTDEPDEPGTYLALDSGEIIFNLKRIKNVKVKTSFQFL